MDPAQLVKCLPDVHELWVLLSGLQILVGQADPSKQKQEEVGSEMQSHAQLHGDFGASLACVRPCFQKR